MVFANFDADGPGFENSAASGFSVALSVFTGPFDALLAMIAERRVALTEVALAQITDEFLAYVRRLDIGTEENMDTASAFLDVAAILVEAKSAALLPSDEQGERDEQSMEALRERDLLFARLVQYRAFKQAATAMKSRCEALAGAYPHPGSLPATHLKALPELAWTLTPGQLAAIAASVFANAPASQVAVEQLHVPVVDFRAQAHVVARRLAALGAGKSATFEQLVEGAHTSVEVAARFLAVLVLFKQGAVQFKQERPFAPLLLRWVGGSVGEDIVGEEEFV